MVRQSVRHMWLPSTCQKGLRKHLHVRATKATLIKNGVQVAGMQFCCQCLRCVQDWREAARKDGHCLHHLPGVLWTNRQGNEGGACDRGQGGCVSSSSRQLLASVMQ